MNILHYSLGLPPYRTGGLTKYSFDLMKEQAKNGGNIYLLFPGRINSINKNTKIKYYSENLNVKSYEIINPLPVPLLSGISSPKEFMKRCDKNVFIDFFIKNNIEVVHIHTLMGLHKEFLEACNELKIKAFYTSHDYFGFCTKVNFIDNKGNLCENRDINKCLKCNKKGFSIKKIQILQSPIYRFCKNMGIIAKLKSILNKTKSNDGKEKSGNKYNLDMKISNEQRKQFKKLLNYYESMFNKIDYFLFNSNVSKSVYDKYIKSHGEVISITHSDIRDNRKLKDFNYNKLKVTYLGPDKKYKGFDMLIGAVKELNKEYEDIIELNMYGDIKNKNLDNNIRVNGRYSYNELENIFDNTDLLIVPSIWYETFGFIVLEALSCGVPVLITDKVGSKDIINDEGLKKGIIIEAKESELIVKIKEIINDRRILKEINNNILNLKFPYNMNEHANIINDRYKELVEKKE